MTKARDNATNVAGDIAGVTAGTGISGGGTSGTITITNDMATTIAAKGDILAGTANDAYSVVTVGANDTVLTADSSTATGLKWATPAVAGFVGVSCTGTGTQSTSNTNWTMVTFGSEQFDTHGFHSTSSNTSRITIPSGKAGYYLFTSHIALDDSSSTGTRQSQFWLNGTDTGKSLCVVQGNPNGYSSVVNSYIAYMSVGDYMETGIRQDSGVSKNIDLVYSNFQAQYLGA